MIIQGGNDEKAPFNPNTIFLLLLMEEKRSSIEIGAMSGGRH
jgi:hypothetical protein